MKALDSITLKQFLVDNNLGIDCSGLAYYILNEESLARGKGLLKSHLFFAEPTQVLNFIRGKIRPVENTSVATLTHNKNSRVIAVKDVMPGDIITMVGGPEGKDRDHVLVVHEVDFREGVLVSISYTHAVAWPTDGEYGHGVRQGVIRVTDLSKNIVEQDWKEAERTLQENYTYTRATKSKTEIRRLVWF